MQAQCQVVLADMPKLLDAAVPLRTLLRPTGVFRARYFLLDDPLAEVDSYHRSLDALQEGDEPPLPASKLWLKTTQGNEDEHSLLTLFACLAAYGRIGGLLSDDPYYGGFSVGLSFGMVQYRVKPVVPCLLHSWVVKRH